MLRSLDHAAAAARRPTGELRKVDLATAAASAALELRLTLAPDEDPEPPRHCQEDMDLVAPVE